MCATLIPVVFKTESPTGTPLGPGGIAQSAQHHLTKWSLEVKVVHPTIFALFPRDCADGPCTNA